MEDARRKVARWRGLFRFLGGSSEKLLGLGLEGRSFSEIGREICLRFIGGRKKRRNVWEFLRFIEY